MSNNTGTKQPAYPRTFIADGGFGSSGQTGSALHRLMPIEGLRAYLALWVLGGHVLWESGYRPQTLSGLSKLIVSGEYAVAFLHHHQRFRNFSSLDKQRETYQQFIVRRFFHLFPVLSSCLPSRSLCPKCAF